MTRALYGRTLYTFVLSELIFASRIGSEPPVCRPSVENDSFDIWDIVMLPLDAVKFIWSYNYIIIIIVLSIDGVLKLADWLLRKPDNNADTKVRQRQKNDSSNYDTEELENDEKETSVLSEMKNRANVRHSQTPPFKSMSMTEADRQKDMSQVDTSRPVAIHYYYGKLIQVTSPHQVQIGDYNTMEIAATSTDEDSDDELSIPRESEEDEEYDVRGESSGMRSNSCSDLLDRSMTLTDDQKTLARSDSHSEPNSDSRRHSTDAAFLAKSKEKYRQSTGSLDTINPVLSEELFVEARFKIFKAAEEYRRSKLEEEASNNVPDKRKSKRFNLKKKK